MGLSAFTIAARDAADREDQLKRKEISMLPKLMQQFEEFARTKPADEKYEYQNPKECAVAQFAKHMGMEDQYYGLFDEKKIINPEPDYVFVEAEIYSATRPHTFGALADRIKNEVHKDRFEDVPEETVDA